MKNELIHETAQVSEHAEIGENSKIWQYCVIMDGVKIGQFCNIGAYVFVEKNVQIGNGVKIKNNVSLYTGVRIEDDVFIGPNVVFTNVINPRSFIDRKKEFKETVIKIGASIGANSTIICGHEIGEYSFVGAGAVVTKDIPAHALVVGNPAKKIGYVCACGGRLKKDKHRYICSLCQNEYTFEGDE